MTVMLYAPTKRLMDVRVAVLALPLLAFPCLDVSPSHPSNVAYIAHPSRTSRPCADTSVLPAETPPLTLPLPLCDRRRGSADFATGASQVAAAWTGSTSREPSPQPSPLGREREE